MKVHAPFAYSDLLRLLPQCVPTEIIQCSPDQDILTIHGFVSTTSGKVECKAYITNADSSYWGLEKELTRVIQWTNDVGTHTCLRYLVI